MRNEIYSEAGEMLELPRPLHNPALDADVLIREANHRIANSLAGVAGMVRMQATELRRRAQPLSAEEARVLLGEIGARIDAVGRLHRLVSHQKDQGRVDLGAHLSEVSLIAAAPYDGMRIIDRCKPMCDLDPTRAGTVTLIVSEMITNAAKHAHPTGIAGVVTVACERLADGSICVEVHDDGVGLPESFDPATDGGLGFQVMRALTIQIGATLTMESDPLGLRARLLVPSEA